MVKTLTQLGMERNFLNLIEEHFQKIQANMFHNKRPYAFPLRLGTRQGCPLLPLLLNILDVLARAIRQ